MMLLGWVLIVALEISLVDYASSSTCQKLNATLFSDCTKAGYNVTEVNPNRTEVELSGLIATMQSKFKNCSSLSSLMTCSVQLPQCPTSAPKLPCKEACKNFVSECQNRSNENDGLMALFRGICELLPSEKCLPTPNNLTNSALDAVKCTRLAIKQCQNAGYSFTSVSDAYQQIVESSAIFQDSDVNSTLRKIICMEIAPPCDAKNNQTLNVPCRSMCDDAFNESQSEFLKVFKAQKYCSTFPESPKNSTGDGRQYCILQDWPVNGYWPSGLWAYLATAGQQPTPPDMANKTAPEPTVNATTPAPTARTATPTPTASAATAVPTVNTTTPIPTSYTSKTVSTTNVKPSVSKAIGTTPAPTPSGNTIVPSTKGTMPAPTPSGYTTALSTNGTTPSPTPNENTIVPSTNGTKPAPTPSGYTTALSTNGTTPSPTPNENTIVPSTKGTKPATTPSGYTTALSANGTKPAPTPSGYTTASSTKGTTPATTPSGYTTAPSSKRTTPASTANRNTTAPSTEGTTPASTPHGNTTAPSTKGTMPATTPKGSTTAPSTEGTTPASTSHGKTTASSTAPSTKRSTHAPTPHKSSTSSSPTSEMKGSSPPDVNASKGGKMSAGAIAGTVLGLLVLVLAIAVGAICFRRYYRTKIQFRHSLMVDMDEL